MPDDDLSVKQIHYCGQGANNVRVPECGAARATRALLLCHWHHWRYQWSKSSAKQSSENK